MFCEKIFYLVWFAKTRGSTTVIIVSHSLHWQFEVYKFKVKFHNAEKFIYFVL